MLICKARLRNTTNALTFRMSSEQTGLRLQFPPIQLVFSIQLASLHPKTLTISYASASCWQLRIQTPSSPPTVSGSAPEQQQQQH